MNFPQRVYVIFVRKQRFYASFYIISRNIILFEKKFSTRILWRNMENVDNFMPLSTRINTFAR